MYIYICMYIYIYIIFTQILIICNQHAALVHAVYAASSQSSHLPTLPPNHRVHFSGGRQTYVRAVARLEWVMAMNAARNQVRGGKGQAVAGIAISRAVPETDWAKSTRIQPSKSGICNHVPENTQSRSARWCYTTHSPPIVASTPGPAAYAPLLAGLPTIFRI